MQNRLSKNDISDLFTCPITQETMSDPVLTEDGQTYEREAITQWLENHNTSPSTNLPLKSKTLIPNIALKNAIKEFKKAYKKAYVYSEPQQLEKTSHSSEKAKPPAKKEEPVLSATSNATITSRHTTTIRAPLRNPSHEISFVENNATPRIGSQSPPWVQSSAPIYHFSSDPAPTFSRGMNPDYDYLFKIIIEGAPQSGKTTFLERLTRNVFVTPTCSGVRHFANKTISINNKILRLQLHDPWCNDSRAVRNRIGAHGLIVLCDLTSEEGLRNLHTQIEKATEHPCIRDRIIIVGTKIDATNRVVSDERLLSEANRLGVKSVLIFSSKTCINTDLVLQEISVLMRASMLTNEQSNSQNTSVQATNSNLPTDRRDQREMEQIWQVGITQGKNQKLILIDLLNDYTKNNSKLSRLFSFHANRSHTSAVNRIVLEAGNKSVNQLFDELSDIQKSVGFNHDGTIAMLIKFLQKKGITSIGSIHQLNR